MEHVATFSALLLVNSFVALPQSNRSFQFHNELGEMISVIWSANGDYFIGVQLLKVKLTF